MPVRDLQARLREAGRIRLGTSKPRSSGRGRQPVRLSTFRLTSKDEVLIRAVADLYGGEARPWELRPGEWEVITDTDELRVVLIPIPGGSLSQWYEYWEQPEMADGKKGAVSCLRRCDGYEQAGGEACVCPSDPVERAKDEQACSLFTRLSVLLPEVPTMGCWRLETQGYYAGVELAAAVSLVDNALAASGLMLEARLRLEQRDVADEGQTIKFPVPVLDITDRLDQVAGLAAGARRGEIEPAEMIALPAPCLERTPGPDVSSGLAAANAMRDREPRQGRRAEPLGTPGPEPSGAPIDADAPEAAEAPAVISESQRRMLHALKAERGLTDDDLKAVVREVTGQDSTKAIPRDQMEVVLAVLQTKEPGQSQFQIPAGARKEQP